MATRIDVQDEDAWDSEEVDDLMEMETDMEEDELFFDDIELETAVGDDEVAESSERYKSFSARRRIEIAREDRWLKSVMADFDDFEGIEDLGGPFAEEYHS